MAAVIQPLDPDSEKGREVAARFNQVLAEILIDIWARRREAENNGDSHLTGTQSATGAA